MFGLQIGFDKPQWLLALILLPILWAVSFRSLAGLGPYRRLFALGFRTLVLVLMVLALAEVQLKRISDRVTVMYLLDQSESIPKITREAMLKYVMQDVAKHRRKGDLQNASEDKAGVIIFGREATIEFPPFSDDIRAVGSGQLDTLFQMRTDATNIAAALKLAQASFPEDTAKRIVIVTDGQENLGDAKTIASTLVENGIGIDVVPIRLNATAEVAVEKIALPADIRRGQEFQTRVVLENFTPAVRDKDGKLIGGTVKGKLRVTRAVGGQLELLSETEETLTPGKNAVVLQGRIDTPSGYVYRADFVPDDAGQDLMLQNNSATAFTHVRGKARVLLIVDSDTPTEFDKLALSLGEKDIEVVKMMSNQLFSSLAELQAYDCVVLANVPRANGVLSTNVEDTASFTDDQIQMLVRNTEQFGAGLLMIGGPNSFGAGGWSNTELEKAMPVDFQIKNAKVRAVGALAMMMHASEIAQGNYWQKVIGIEALKVLGPMDYCGVAHWDNFSSKEDWLWRDKKGMGLVQVGTSQKSMMAKLDRMQPGDMPDFEPAMLMTYKELARCPASVKHAIIISDGDPSPPGASVGMFKKAKIKVSTVAVGAHGTIEDTRLRGIAEQTGGKFYRATNPKALPRIFQIEARRVARPLVKEDQNGIPVGIVDRRHEMVGGIEGDPPPIKGFVLTQVKENPLVEVVMRAGAMKDAGPENTTILARWIYGAGKTAVITTDAGQRWATPWQDGWESFDKLYTQVIRDVMRPVNEQADYSIATDVKDGKVRVVVTALKKDGEFLNFLDMSAVGTGPKMENISMQMRQEAPGRYVGEMPATEAGSYLLAINPGKGPDGKQQPPLLTGVNVPYSAEFRERETNDLLITTLASLKPKGGEVGVKMPDFTPSQTSIDKLIGAVDTFRRTLPKAMSSKDIWPLILLLAAGIFLVDVAIRRITIHFYWVAPAVAYGWGRLMQRPLEPVRTEAMERLRSKKAAVTSQLDERRASARFDPQVDADTGTPQRELGDVLQDATGGSSSATHQQPLQPPPSSAAGGPEQDTYTERLMAAKKKARKDMGG
ncbi:MAG: VWA domain-containing protein [Pirellulaceae bacterium]|nr:VWA domain-containing protein [Pirellulaceae bacterium]